MPTSSSALTMWARGLPCAMASSIWGNSAAMRRAFDGGCWAALRSKLAVNASSVIGLPFGGTRGTEGEALGTSCVPSAA